jgi:hypothetical protein
VIGKAATMPRLSKQSIADIDVMADSVERLKTVLYAKPYFETRYRNALARVIADLGVSGRIFESVFGNEREKLIEILRRQFP